MVSSLCRQRGLAIVTVLLVLAIAMVIAATMTQRLGLQIRRAENLVTYSQAQQYALGAEQFAMRVLKQDFKDSPNSVHLGQYWASGEQQYPVEGGVIIGRIRDLQACFNLNGAAGTTPGVPRETAPAEALMLQQLLEQAGIESYEAETVAESTRDWLDGDDQISGSLGAEDAEYSSRTPPYVTANGLMADVSEWRLVRGVSSQLFTTLKPLVCVIPGQAGVLVNVNTLQPEQAAVLAGLFAPAMSLSQAEQLIANRPKTGWNSLEAFMSSPEMHALGPSLTDAQKRSVTVTSNFFVIEAEAQVDRARFRLTSILRRDGSNRLMVVQRRFGGWQ